MMRTFILIPEPVHRYRVQIEFRDEVVVRAFQADGFGFSENAIDRFYLVMA